jgi:methylmalonic aciduria homocystinuria type C protein
VSGEPPGLAPDRARADALTRDLAGALAPAGLDLVQPLQVGWYNDAVPVELALPAPAGPTGLVVLVGNTVALWPRFRAAYASDPSLRASADPLDTYVERAVRAACARPEVPEVHDVRFAHEPPPRLVAIQRAAAVSGLAALSPAHLCVHVVHGPWISLRAVILTTLRFPAPAPTPPSPCHACDQACGPALAAALAAGPATRDGVAAEWRRWLAIRDACPVGRAHRYPDAWLRYGYTKDRAALDEP